MDGNIYIGIYCSNFDEARRFYVKNFGFEEKTGSKVECGRVLLTHAIINKLEVEFIHPSSMEQSRRIDRKGGTINLFTIPTREIDIVKLRLENTAFFINYVEAPYAAFLTIEDPMGNHICLYENS